MLLLLLSLSAVAADWPPLDAALTGYDYPHPVHTHALTWQGHEVSLAYMDVPPAAAPSGEVYQRTWNGRSGSDGDGCSTHHGVM